MFPFAIELYLICGKTENFDNGNDRPYKHENGTWTQIGTNIIGEASFDEAGRSVSLSSDGTIVAIGAFGNDDNGTNSGHVRVYKLQDYVKLKTAAPYAPSVGASYFDTATDKFMIYNGSAWKSYSADE